MNGERIVLRTSWPLGYPVTPLHTLIIPRRHVSTFFELGQAEINACTFLVKDEKKRIEAEDRSVDGFNIGMNNGVSAGQTVIIAIYILFLAELVT
jgi:ATP adenylyltransferase